jgi:adenosylcobinamide-phosphate synthase
LSVARAIGLLLGVLADGAIGDPERGRPAARFTHAAAVLEQRMYADDRVRGAVYTASVTGATVLAGVIVERATRRSPVLHATGTAVATWAVLGAARLAADGTQLARDLETGRLEAARCRLSDLDTRKTDELDVLAVSRAAVEAVAVDTADVVVAPLLWGAAAGVPGLLGSRALIVLRRLTGHRDPRYRRFGLLATRAEQVVNLLPTRAAAALTVAAAPVVGGSARASWRAWQRDTVLHPEPNAGRVEAAFAGALEIRLGGRTVYPHGVVDLPVLGDGRNPDAGHVTRAVELSRVVGWLAGPSAAALAILSGLRRRRMRRS